jgi:aromatic-L-amino-acid decarboxylase
MVAGIHLDNLRTLEVELPTLALTPEILGAAIKADKEKGLIPTFAVATIGTTSTNANDPIDLLGALCNKEDVWIHIDAAYGGSALILPELQHLMRGVELVDSFNFNPHKWMRINFDCSAFWVKDKEILVDALSVTPEYLRNKLSDSGAVVDYRDWQIPLGRRFRALKVWFALRTYGVKGMQDFIRSHIKMAEELEKWIEADSRFELVFKRSLALVCFRVKATNELNQKLVESINASREFYLTHTVIGGQYLIRFSIGAPQTELRHVEHCWKTLQAKAAELLSLEAAN